MRAGKCWLLNRVDVLVSPFSVNKRGERVVGSFVLVFSFMNIAMNITESILYARRQFGPLLGLVNASLKTVVWGAYFILVSVNTGVGGLKAVDLVVTAILLVTSIIQIVFSAKYMHVERIGGAKAQKQRDVAEA